jgi:hypothetical protein
MQRNILPNLHVYFFYVDMLECEVDERKIGFNMSVSVKNELYDLG